MKTSNGKEKRLTPVIVSDFINQYYHGCNEDGLLLSGSDGKKYLLQDAHYFSPLLLLHAYNWTDGKEQTITFDFSEEDCINMETLDGKIRISDRPFGQWTIAKTDGKAISI